MPRPLFEQYKDALRRGHLAVVAGELDEALDAYQEAASLVPERPLPHASMATVLHRLGRRAESRAAMDTALRLGADDEATLHARDAILAEPMRVANVETTARLEEAPSWADGLPEAAADPDTDVDVDVDRPLIALAPEGQGPVSATGWRPQPEVREPGAEWPAIDLPSLPPPPFVGPPPDPLVLQAQADALLDAGDTAAARDLLLTAAAVYESLAQFDAALDVCLQLLAITPGDPRVHLAIASLQLDHGWRPIATEKIELLIRLTSLTGDTQAEADVRLLAADRLQDVPA